MNRIFAITLLLAYLPAATPAAYADSIDIINNVRSSACSAPAGALSKLERNSRLDEVARLWSLGGRLREALENVRYHARASVSKHIGGIEKTRELTIILASEYCHELSNPIFEQIGVHLQGKSYWMVLASPATFPAAGSAEILAQRVLDRVNEARATARQCGSTVFAAVPPLRLESPLTRAAHAHAIDMAARDMLDHRGSDGSRPGQRVTILNYAWGKVGENIASGVFNADDAVDAWLRSSGHCSTIMDADFKAMGVAFAVDPNSRAGIYWVQLFAADP